MKMKVVHIIWSFTTGGTECRLIDQLNQLAGSVEQSLVIINKHYEPDLLNNIDSRVKIFRVNRPIHSLNLFYYIKLNYIINNISPDIVVCHVASISKLLLFKKYILLLHLHGLKEAIKEYIKYFDGFIAISKDVANHILSYNNYSNPILVYNGIDARRFETKSKARSGVFKIVNVGRLCDEVKGQSVLLKALSLLENKYGLKDVEVVFIGDGPSRKNLEELAKNLKLEHCVRFLGNKKADYLYSNLKNNDLSVLSSYREGLGNTIIEAMAAKVPVLVSDLPGPMEVIDYGKYGYYFTCGDHAACCEKIYEIYSKSLDNFNEHPVEEAYLRVINNFDISVMADRLLKVYLSYLPHNDCTSIINTRLTDGTIR